MALYERWAQRRRAAAVTTKRSRGTKRSDDGVNVVFNRRSSAVSTKSHSQLTQKLTKPEVKGRLVGEGKPLPGNGVITEAVAESGDWKSDDD